MRSLQNTSELNMIYLTRDELIEIHHDIIKQSGGSSGILNPSNILSCIETPCRTVFGSEVNKTLSEKAAALVYEVCKSHPFVDGNKRTGYGAADVFLQFNGYFLDAKKEDAKEMTMELAKCTMDREETVKWITAHICCLDV